MCRARVPALPVLVALLILGAFPIYHPAPARATTARWVRLDPPATDLQGTPFTLDTNRNRVIALSPAFVYGDLWCASSDSIPRWSLLDDVPPPGSDTTFDLIGIQYDPARDRLWLLTSAGVMAGHLYPARVWAMDLGAPPLHWVEHGFTGTAPVGISKWTLLLDPSRDRILAYGPGGISGGGGLFTLDLGETPNWSQPYSALFPSPGQRHDAALAYDPWHDRMLLHGGATYNAGIPTYYDETWALSFGGTPAWSFLPPRQHLAYARAGAASALDPLTRRWIVTGGAGPGAGPDPDPNGLYNDTWSLDLSPDAPSDSATWIPTSAGGGDPRPSARYRAIAWSDLSGNRVVLYGGQRSSQSLDPRVDFWALPMTASPAWHPLTNDSLLHPAEIGHVSCVDPAAGNLISVLGGSGMAWVQPLDSQAGHTPGTGSVLFDAAAAADPAGARILAFGGSTDSPGLDVQDGLWSFPFSNPQSPTQLASGGPAARTRALAVFDSLHARFLVHGGRWTTPQSHVVPFADTWAWDVSGGTWGALPAGGFGGRWDEAGICDPVRNRMIVFGGRDTTYEYNDVHVLSLDPGGTWQPLATTGSPPPLQYSALARAVYDPAADRMLVVARDDVAPNPLGVWQLTLDATPTWARLNANGDPPAPRLGYAAAFDRVKGRLLVTAGQIQGYSPTLTSEEWAFYLDETTPTLLSLVSCDAAAGLVRIVWQGDGIATATAWRRSAGSAWKALGTLAADAHGRLVLEDRDVQPLVTYEYRLGLAGGSYMGNVFATVPATLRLALTGTVPQPASGELRVAFTLPSAAPATLELLDVAGRRVLARPVGALGAGSHTLRLDPTPRPGLYFLRLTQGNESRIARTVILR